LTKAHEAIAQAREERPEQPRTTSRQRISFAANHIGEITHEEVRMAELKSREEIATEMKQLISFTVGAEEYGLELLRVKEVIRMRQITWLPKAPSCVKGIINLRGDVIPIVDLRDRFGLASIENTAMTRVIVVEVESQPVGMVVDATSQVVRVPADQFAPPPPMMGRIARDFITDVGKIGERLIILIDVNRILSTEQMNQIAGSVLTAREPALGHV
jgi:purine-binding chemotaxis protein CheW